MNREETCMRLHAQGTETDAYGRITKQKFEIKTENQKRATAPTKKN